MKTIFFVTAICFSIAAGAQVKKVTLQASGLTCSMCSNAINKALKSINFVEEVTPNIRTSTFDITFKSGDGVDFDVLKNKVEGAGFFVSKFVANFYFDNVKIQPGQPVVVGDKTFQFMNSSDEVLSGEKAIQIMDKGFVPAKQFRKNNFPTIPAGGRQVYHVTI